MANTEEDLSRPQEEKPRKSASKVRSSSKKDNKVEHPKRAKGTILIHYVFRVTFLL